MGFHSPFSILVIGGLVGIFVFAVSSAFTVRFRRNQAASEAQGQTTSLSSSLLKVVLFAGVVFAIVSGINAIHPHTLLQQEGLLVGKDLFTVRSRAGFTAAYPPRSLENIDVSEEVEPGKVLVIFRPNPDPKEIAAALVQRDILQEQLTFERSRRPALDVALQNQLDSLQRRLDILNQRQRDLINQRESYRREEAKNMTARNGEYRQIEQQVTMIDSESKQTAVSLQNAEMEMRSAAELVERGFISQRDRDSRVAAYKVLQSKLEELKDRARFLEREKVAMRGDLADTRQRSRDQLATLDRWLAEVETTKQQVTTEHDEVSKRLEEESTHARERHLPRIRQLELQVAEVSTVLSSPETSTPIEVTAPWLGYVGYRELSPASLRPDTGPLIVMFKPEHIWVELQTPMEMTRDLTSDNVHIKLSVDATSVPSREFPGRLETMRPLPDEEKVALRISTTPPPALVRRLALGEEVRAQVHISSKGLALTSLIEKMPASVLTNHFSWTNFGIPSIPILVSLGLFLITFRTLYTRRVASKEIAMRNPHHDSFAIKTSAEVNRPGTSHNQSYSHGSESANLPSTKGFVYDFRSECSEGQHMHPNIACVKPSWSLDNIVLPQLQCIVQEQQTVTHAMKSMLESRSLFPLKNGSDQCFQDLWDLGRELHRSIMAQDGDTSVLDALHERIEQHGIWVMPFIASALPADLSPDILLGHSLKLCVKRLSQLQPTDELGPTVCDLTRYLYILQRFFPAVVKQIIPNLQQGLTVALQIAAGELGTTGEGDKILEMMQEIFTAMSNPR